MTAVNLENNRPGARSRMRGLPSTITTCVLIGAAAIPARAWAMGRSAEVHRSLSRVYASVSNYFAADSMHDFQIVSASKSRSKVQIVATRTTQDQMKWRQWAYCKVPALQMFDTLQQGNITVRVEIHRDSADRTWVTVTPDFQGVYALAGNSHTQQCQSKGVLEKDILLGAGASPDELNF
jgi:hypothetical protein